MSDIRSVIETLTAATLNIFQQGNEITPILIYILLSFIAFRHVFELYCFLIVKNMRKQNSEITFI